MDIPLKIKIYKKDECSQTTTRIPAANHVYHLSHKKSGDINELDLGNGFTLHFRIIFSEVDQN